MKPENIHVLGLIGLRALAEIDPVEYKRSTDFSKYEVEQKIEVLLNIEDEEANWLYKEFKNILNNSQSDDEVNFLLKRLYMISFQKAQHLSLIFSRENKQHINYEPNWGNNYYEGKKDMYTEQDSFLKLSVMRLLKDLKDYNPIFNYKIKNNEIDCLLEPQNEELPYIIIETKRVIKNLIQLDKSLDQLNKYISFWGKNTIGLIITGGYEDVGYNRLNPNYFIIQFDYQNNQLYGNEYDRFLEFINNLHE